MNPGDTLSAEIKAGSGAMFDGIAPRYDLINRLSSLGLDQGWRRRLVRALLSDQPRRVLDLATGTADVALALARADEALQVVGVDPSANMLQRGREKVARAGLEERIELVQGDAQALPYPDDWFDAVGISFGIRNVPDRLQGLREMVRVTRPGGTVAILELGEPRRGLLAPLARMHVHWIVPRLGAWLSGAKEYRYLASSMAAFPEPPEFQDLMREAGLQDVSCTPMGFQAAHLFVGQCPGT